MTRVICLIANPDTLSKLAKPESVMGYYKFEIDGTSFSIATVPGSGVCKVQDAEGRFVGFFSPSGVEAWPEKGEAFEEVSENQLLPGIEQVGKYINRHRLITFAVFGSPLTRTTLAGLPRLDPLAPGVRILFDWFERPDEAAIVSDYTCYESGIPTRTTTVGRRAGTKSRGST